MTATAALMFLLAAGSLPAEPQLMRHPDEAGKVVEFFVRQPAGRGPWPTIVFVHGHQDAPRRGGRDFLAWGVLDRFAKKGYLAVAVSQPGYGGSSGPADFCGPLSQRAVSAVVKKLLGDGWAAPGRVVLHGISRGALVAGLLATQDPSLAGVVLISGVYDLESFAAEAKSLAARLVLAALRAETGGDALALRSRSVLPLAGRIRCRVLMLNGEQDDRSSAAQARLLAERIKAQGGQARAMVYPEYGHQIPVKVRDEVIDPFIESVLKR